MSPSPQGPCDHYLIAMHVMLPCLIEDVLNVWQQLLTGCGHLRGFARVVAAEGLLVQPHLTPQILHLHLLGES